MILTTDSLFRALSDQTRLRCLLLLKLEGELCVCELTHALELSQPKISRHLAVLREADIVSDRRDGTWVYYRISPLLPNWVQGVFQETASGVGSTSPFAEDRHKLKSMPNRPASLCCP